MNTKIVNNSTSPVRTPVRNTVRNTVPLLLPPLLANIYPLHEGVSLVPGGQVDIWGGCAPLCPNTNKPKPLKLHDCHRGAVVYKPEPKTEGLDVQEGVDLGKLVDGGGGKKSFPVCSLNKGGFMAFLCVKVLVIRKQIGCR